MLISWHKLTIKRLEKERIAPKTPSEEERLGAQQICDIIAPDINEENRIFSNHHNPSRSDWKFGWEAAKKTESESLGGKQGLFWIPVIPPFKDKSFSSEEKKSGRREKTKIASSSTDHIHHSWSPIEPRIAAVTRT